MVITSKLTDEELIKRIHLAASVYSNLIDKSFLIIGKNKKSSYFGFECYFRKRHFMHLLGIKSRTLSAEQFYDKCSCCSELLCIKNARYMKIGLKDKIFQYVDFTYAYGGEAILGFQRDDSEAGFPITLIPRNIDEFSSQKYKIMFIFEKSLFSPKYNKMIVEIKNGIFSQSYFDLPEFLKQKIDLKK